MLRRAVTLTASYHWTRETGRVERLPTSAVLWTFWGGKENAYWVHFTRTFWSVGDEGVYVFV